MKWYQQPTNDECCEQDDMGWHCKKPAVADWYGPDSTEGDPLCSEHAVTFDDDDIVVFR